MVIDDNFIFATRQGIDYKLSFAESTISDNTITVLGDNTDFTNGIHAWFTENLIILNNRIKGSGQDAAIFLRDNVRTKVDRNTVEPTETDNGIAVETGETNMILQNEILNAPTNAIGNFSSSGNVYHDNDIEADNVGLLIGRNLSTDQEITCNRFCDGNIDVSIGSLIGLQDHHRNQFRQVDSRARVVGLDPQDIEFYRFTYDPEHPTENSHCGNLELFVNPDNDPSNVFESTDGTSTESCDEDSGADFTLPPPVICDRIMEARLDPNTWYAQLRQLLGRYFATYGPRQLPDCFLCEPTTLISMEAELRQASVTSSDTSESENSDFRAIAEQQYNLLGGGGDIVYLDGNTCSTPIRNVELYTETYKLLVKHIAYENLTENDISQLASVAELCDNEYGEVVGWARGLLHTYEVYNFIVPNCEELLAPRHNLAQVGNIDLVVYPLPADDFIHLKVAGNTAESVTISLSDLTGRILYSKTYNRVGLNKISTSELDNGMYILSLESEDHGIISKKIHVQH